MLNRYLPSRPWKWRLVLLLSLCSASCSGGETLNPVHGKVLYQTKPLSGALVTFHPQGTTDLTVVPPVGLTGEDGGFTVTTGKKDGALAGTYVVTIICSEIMPTGDKAISTGGPETRDRLQGAYANRATSKITVEIKKGVNQLEAFDLK